MHVYYALLILAFSFLQINSQDFTPTSSYANSVVFLPNQYALFWNYTKKDITGEVHVKTNGWVGFGLSPNGGMNGGDVFVAWIDENNKVNFTDRYIVDRSVLIDKSQDWSLILGLKRNGFTIIKFTRLIATCDPNNQDLVIEPGTPRVIYSWSDTLPSNGVLLYHGPNNRGVQSVPLITSFNRPSPIKSDDNIKTYDFTINASLPNGFDTVYWCQMFKIPTELINNKAHLLRVETIFTPGNENLVHHWLLYACSNNYEQIYLKNNSQPNPGMCFGLSENDTNSWGTWDSVAGLCPTINLLWAVGGSLILDFPDGLGFPIGGSDKEFTYFYIQMHYNNPQLRSNIVDKTTLRFYVTSNLRKTEIGVFTVAGFPDASAILLPPQVANFQLDFYCKKECLNKWYTGGNITVFAVAPHTHLLGTQVYTKIIRGNKEVGYVDKTKNYDFNYQYINYLQTPVNLTMNDELHTTCVYNTMSRSNYAYGGISTSEEMCMDFLFYYPRKKNTGGCFGTKSAANWVDFLFKLNQTGAITLTAWPPTAQSFGSDIKTKLKTSAQITTMIVNFFKNANESEICLTSGEYTMNEYAFPNALVLNETSTCSKSDASSFIRNNFSIILFASIMILTFFN